jgi:hypothetical protein
VKERRGQRFVEQRDAVGQAAAVLEERQQRGRRARERFDARIRHGEAPRGAAILELGIDVRERNAVAVLGFACRLCEEAQEVRGVRALRAVAFREPSRRELRDQGMHVQAVALLAQKRLVGQRAEDG